MIINCLIVYSIQICFKDSQMDLDHANASEWPREIFDTWSPFFWHKVKPVFWRS
jgi:hypothetical protein